MIKNTNLKKVNIYLSTTQIDALKRTSKIQSVSYATLIRLAINEYLDKR